MPLTAVVFCPAPLRRGRLPLAPTCACVLSSRCDGGFSFRWYSVCAGGLCQKIRDPMTRLISSPLPCVVWLGVAQVANQLQD